MGEAISCCQWLEKEFTKQIVCESADHRSMSPMKHLITNFFEITTTPEIVELCVTQRADMREGFFRENLKTNLDRTSVISLCPINETSKLVPRRDLYIEWLFKKAIFDAMEIQSGIYFDIDYREGEVTLLPESFKREKEFSILRRVRIRVFHSQKKLLLALEPFTKIYNRISLAKLISDWDFPPSYFLQQKNCLVLIDKDDERVWVRGKIKYVDQIAKVDISPLFDGTIEVSPSRVIPSLDRASMARIVEKSHKLDLFNLAKGFSQQTSTTKLKSIESLFAKYIGTLFPMRVQGYRIEIASEPVDSSIFSVQTIEASAEPKYVVTRGDQKVIGSGRLQTLGQFNFAKELAQPRDIVLFAPRGRIEFLRRIINRLNTGYTSGNFSMSLPEKFNVFLNVVDTIEVPSEREYGPAIDDFLYSLNETLQNSFPIFYLPPSSDFYYGIKAKFANYGKASQAISQDIADIYSAWNLATNLYAKLGGIPWGLADNPNIEQADIVLGLAYSSLRNEGRLKRNIGYVNVFDRNGVWKFVRSSSEYFDFDQRERLIPRMIENALLGFREVDDIKVIDIHYTKKFSIRERKNIYQIAKSVLNSSPQINFISIDDHHGMWVFDPWTSNHNFQRGGILQLSSNEFLLSMSGETRNDAFAPRLLKVQVWQENDEVSPSEILPIAYRILAMSNLNWRSPVRPTHEPVTLKFAAEIAKMTNYFDLTEWKTVNNKLASIPWFI